MLQHEVLIPLSIVPLSGVQKIHVPALHADQDIVTILYEILAPFNEREIWKHEFLNQNSKILLK